MFIFLFNCFHSVCQFCSAAEEFAIGILLSGLNSDRINIHPSFSHGKQQKKLDRRGKRRFVNLLHLYGSLRQDGEEAKVPTVSPHVLPQLHQSMNQV